MLNRIFVVDSVTLSSTGTAVSSYVPWEQTTRKLPTQVVVKATGQGAYVRLSNDNSAATNVDVLVQGGDHVVLSVQGRRWVSVLSDGASSTVSVGALSTGVSGDAASLSLDFAGTGTLDPRVTFTRASTGTFFNSAGVLTSAAINAPRFDYDPSTLAAQGLLIEESRTNLITSSAVLPAGVNVTITADTFVAPDGTTTGDQILDNATLGEHYSDSSFTPTAATNYTFSAYIKNIGASSSNYAVVRMAGDFAAYVFVQLSDMTVALAGGAGLVANSASVTPANNGWYRVTVSGLSTGTVASVARIQVAQSLSLSAYVGTGVGFAVWGRQLEAGAFPTSYIPTTATALTRAADVASVNTLSPWFNAAEGTLFAEASVSTVNDSATPFAASISDPNIVFASRNVVASIGRNASSSAVGLRVVSGGVNQLQIDAGTVTPNVSFKAALAYKTNDGNGSVNGSIATTDTSLTVPVVTTLVLGNAGWLTPSNSVLNGYLRRIVYYPRRLSNAELQSITS